MISGWATRAEHLVTTVDIDRDTAHDAAQRELAKPIYPKASLSERLSEWLDELLYRLIDKGSSIPGGWLTITVLTILVIAGIVFAVRVARRTMRTNRSGDQGLFGIHVLSAQEHRITAEQCASVGDWDSAIRHRLRAIARQLEEDAVLNPVPGRTATELAHDAGDVLPAFASDLSRSAALFNDVTYGKQPGSEPGYRLIADLDERLSRHVAPPMGSESAATAGENWAPLK